MKRPIVAFALTLFILLAGAWYLASAGPLSSQEIIQQTTGVPVVSYVLTCTDTSANNYLDPVATNQLLRLSAEATPLYVSMGTATTTAATYNAAMHIGVGQQVYVQNGVNPVIACITRGGTGYLSITVLR